MASSDTRKVTLKLTATVIAMFVFAVFIMPPIYDVFCDITGLNGKTGGQYEAVSAEINRDRTVKVQFLATNNESMPWRFEPMLNEIRVHPGEEVEVRFYARNPTNRDMVAQAVPSVIPFKAAEHFHKTECFCFNSQPLKAGESTEMALRFIVDPDVEKTVNTITLSYTLFDITATELANNQSAAQDPLGLPQ